MRQAALRHWLGVVCTATWMLALPVLARAGKPSGIGPSVSRSPAGAPFRSSPRLCCWFSARAQRQRHASEQVAGVGQVVVLKTQLAGQSATAQTGFVERHAQAVALHRQLGLVRVAEFVSCQCQRRRRGAQHQWLAGGHEDADRAVIGRDAGGLHQGVELANQFVALVQQVVRGMAVALLVADLAVGVGDLRGQLVDRAAHWP